jgi:hypothetical protein
MQREASGASFLFFPGFGLQQRLRVIEEFPAASSAVARDDEPRGGVATAKNPCIHTLGDSWVTETPEPITSGSACAVTQSNKAQLRGTN